MWTDADRIAANDERALVSTRAAAALGVVVHVVAGAFTSLWVAAADIGELVFARWLRL